MTNLLPPIEQMQGDVELWDSGRPVPKVNDWVRWHSSLECPYRCPECGRDLHIQGPVGEGRVVTVAKHDGLCMRDVGAGGPGCGQAIPLTYEHCIFVRVTEPPPKEGTGFWAHPAELEVIEEPE